MMVITRVWSAWRWAWSSNLVFLVAAIVIGSAIVASASHITEDTEYTVFNSADGEIVGTILPPVPGDGESAPRVEYRLKLYKGKLNGGGGQGGRAVYFVITDASNKDFAERFGAILSKRLTPARLPPEVIESANFRDNGADGQWRFFADPGRVTRKINGEVRPPRSNAAYSPLKQITYDPDGPAGPKQPIQVVINAPFIKWGDGPGQTLLIDSGGCDELIRRNPPSALFEGNGPPGCDDDPVGDPLARYRGGQVTALNITPTGGTVTMKLHAGTFQREAGHSVYYEVFEASKAGAAGFMGVIWAPKLANLGRPVEEFVGGVVQFGNGVPDPSGGPTRFQHGLVSYPADSIFYTPMWHIRTVYWNLDQDGDGFMDGIVLDNICNQSLAPLPDPEACGNQEAPGITFDPYQLWNDFGGSIKNVAFSGAPPIPLNEHLDEGLLSDGAKLNFLLDNLPDSFILTDAPGGLIFDDASEPLIVSCPSPVSVLPVGAELVPVPCDTDADCKPGYTCVLTHTQNLCYNFDL